MNRKICDGCDTAIAADDVQRRYVRVIAPPLTPGGYDSTTHHLDLCGACVASFAEWLEARKG